MVNRRLAAVSDPMNGSILAHCVICVLAMIMLSLSSCEKADWGNEWGEGYRLEADGPLSVWVFVAGTRKGAGNEEVALVICYAGPDEGPSAAGFTIRDWKSEAGERRLGVTISGSPVMGALPETKALYRWGNVVPDEVRALEGGERTFLIGYDGKTASAKEIVQKLWGELPKAEGGS